MKAEKPHLFACFAFLAVNPAPDCLTAKAGRREGEGASGQQFLTTVKGLAANPEGIV
jgi:hypothetical protein